MKTRNMVGAFLICNDKALFMRRSLNKKIAPGKWSCVGGHIEPDEMNNPAIACFREIEEETGIAKEQIKNLRLRYVTTRYTGEELRTGYYFFGEVERICPLPYCSEGELYWLNISDISEKEMSFSVKKIMEHWLSNPLDEAMYLCGINRANDEMTWTEL
ncbi:NUDIX domain-containing protein [Tyzzerella sp. OttesenSCG-928-J15]|nr:NUDIX domain-containing protein [Tyzzerella sp. OttesenSCG-928-J15]